MRRLTLTFTKRADGRFCKKIGGKFLYWHDAKEARTYLIELARRREREDTDVEPIHVATDPPLRDIANAFRHARKPKVLASSWSDYETAIDQFLAVVGKLRTTTRLKPDDFRDARARWAKTLGPWKLDNRIQSIRSMFNWAHESARLIDRLPWYGDEFHKTTSAEKRHVARERIAEHGLRVFSAAELRRILNTATGAMRAFVLLGLNGGMYGADIARLRKIDLRREGKLWLIDNDRFKTGVWRRFILWPETVEAVAAARDTSDHELLFLTAHGNPWVNGETHSVTLMFGRMLETLEIKRGGVNFGSLRHTHVSAIGDHPDLNAARLVRGHKFAGIELHYDFPDLRRIKAVTDLARRRLLTSVVRSRPKPRRSHERPRTPDRSRELARSS